MSIYDAAQLCIEGKVVRELSSNGKKLFPKLPEGYIELEYIESAASQYIKTGVKVNPNYTVSVDFMLTKRTTTWDTIFGTRNGQAARFTARFTNTATGKLGIHRSVAVGTTCEQYDDSKATKDKVTNGFHNVRLAKNKYYFDGELRYNFKAATSLTKYNYELYLFANNNAGGVGDAGYFRIRFCTIQDENDNFVRHFIPCKNPNGVAGMYDVVNKKFYGSSSSTAFVAGNVKEA